MNDYTYETVTSENGNHRARVILDEHSYDMKPDGDCYGTVLYQETGWYRSNVDVWCERYKSTDDWESIYSDLWSVERDLDQIERTLRGTLNVCEECERLLKYVESEDEWIAEGALVDSDLYCINGDGEEFCEPRYDFSDNPVVGFDVTELREGRLINIVSLEDLKVWGWGSVEDFNAAMTKIDRHGVDPSDGNLKEFEAYANGEVYFIAVESKVIETTIIKTIDQKVIREVEREDWETEEALHGFYDTEHALEEAKSLLAYVVEHQQEIASERALNELRNKLNGETA